MWAYEGGNQSLQHALRSCTSTDHRPTGGVILFEPPSLERQEEVMMEEDDTDSDEEPLKGGDVESGSTASKTHVKRKKQFMSMPVPRPLPARAPPPPPPPPPWLGGVHDLRFSCCNMPSVLQGLKLSEIVRRRMFHAARM